MYETPAFTGRRLRRVTEKLVAERGEGAVLPFHELRQALVELARSARDVACGAAALRDRGRGAGLPRAARPRERNGGRAHKCAALRNARGWARGGAEPARPSRDLPASATGLTPTWTSGGRACSSPAPSLTRRRSALYPSARAVVVVDLPGHRPTTRPDTGDGFRDRPSPSQPPGSSSARDLERVLRLLVPDGGIRVVGNVHRYHEKVSLDCPHEERTWTVRADLDFRFRRPEGGVAMTDYQLRDRLPQHDVLVDEGSLVVRRSRPTPDQGPR